MIISSTGINLLIFLMSNILLNVYINGLPSEEEARLAQDYFNSLPDGTPVDYLQIACDSMN